jgi:glycosyltransferase involved in cell wall biosynthesis
VQASSYIEAGFGKTRNSDRNYARLGYAGAMTTMPHIRRIVERHYGIAAPVVPPCIAPWFFGSADGPRRKQVVFCPKPWCQDYPIVRPMLVARARALGWSVLELTDRPHKQVARAFQRAAIHVNVNCHESFNATVPEAMAAGCIAICYEAFGGRDFLRNGKNAYVFPTHHAYPLVEHTLELMASWDARTAETDKVRKHAATTAARYTEAVTERALLRYFRRLSDAA